MFEKAMWIGIPANEYKRKNILEGDMTGRFAYFRNSFRLKEKAKLKLLISANSRYRLWVNGIPVLSGPCKGDLSRHYYETIDVSEYLQSGENVLAVQVLYQYPEATVNSREERSGIYGVFTPGGGHRLAVEGGITDGNEMPICDISTGIANWKVMLDAAQYLHEFKICEFLGATSEAVDFNLTPNAWKLPAYDDEAWPDARILEPVQTVKFEKMVGLIPRFQMKERPIPLLYEKDCVFEKNMKIVILIAGIGE